MQPWFFFAVLSVLMSCMHRRWMTARQSRLVFRKASVLFPVFPISFEIPHVAWLPVGISIAVLSSKNLRLVGRRPRVESGRFLARALLGPYLLPVGQRLAVVPVVMLVARWGLPPRQTPLRLAAR
ncbi:hypothetical protein ACA085_19780, partial [Xanthomonas fragariae]